MYLFTAFTTLGLLGFANMNSELARDYRLVAMDMRGHGPFEKPREGYADSHLWADDVRAVIIKATQP